MPSEETPTVTHPIDRRRAIQISQRLDPSLLERADALIDDTSRRYGRVATRADVLREALARGLEVLELHARGRSR